MSDAALGGHPGLARYDGRVIGLGVRPEHVRLSRNGAGGDAISFDGRIEVVEYLGDEQLVHFTRKDAPLQAKLPVEEKVGAGDEVTFTLPREKLYLFDRESEQRVRS